MEDPINTLIELHRDGTVLCRMSVWPWRPGASYADPKKVVRLQDIYRAWAGGLCVFRDLASHHGLPSVAVAKAGCLSFSKRELMGHDEFHVLHVLKELVESSVTFDPILLTETWDPRDILAIWAGEMANWLGEAKAFSCPPYVK